MTLTSNTPFQLRTLTAALCLAGLSLPTLAQTASATSVQEQLLQRVELMQQELNSLKSELARVKATQTQTQATAEQANTTAQQAKTEIAAVVGTGLKASSPDTVLTGYGEISYNRYRNNAAATQADLRRAVIGIQHRFDEKTKYVLELEVEHAVASAGDKGEVEIEQAYVEHEISPHLSVRGGLFLIPMGLLNENHEPHAYYGVERNFVESAIIPSTWREGGVMAIGNLDNGLTYKMGISTGFDLGKWSATSTEGKDSPLRSTHQELSFAKAKDLSLLGSLEWRGYPGLLLGGGVFSGKAGHSGLVNNLGAPVSASPTVTLWDLHARWTPGKWDLAAVYARGTISDTVKLNAAFAADPTPIPAMFDGSYVQAAYRLWRSGNYQLTPFARYERFNTAKAFAGFAPGLSRASDPYEQVSTVGATFNLTPTVVLKSDIQNFKVNKALNRFNVGLGWAF